MNPPANRSFFPACRVYREAHARYTRAFARGDVEAIEDAFSRMQELGLAFKDGAKWADAQRTAKSRP
ncbi:MAG TPA: hypothetical protein VGF97_15840 [Rhizomicrobium sp.]|jgi:hypothetical protein